MKPILKVSTPHLHFQQFAIIFLEVCRDFAASLCLTKEREAGAVASNGGNFSRNPPLMRSHLCPQQKDEWKKTSKIDKTSVPYKLILILIDWHDWYFLIWLFLAKILGLTSALTVFPNHYNLRPLRIYWNTWQTWNLLNSLHLQDSQFLKFYRRKREIRNIFRNKSRWKDALLMYLKKLSVFYSNTN